MKKECCLLSILVILWWLPPVKLNMKQSIVITYFDCSEDDRNRLTSLEEVEECGDLLAYVGVEVARDVIGSKIKLDFHNIEFDSAATSKVKAV